jgi:hypothetical protein
MATLPFIYMNETKLYFRVNIIRNLVDSVRPYREHLWAHTILGLLA